MVFREILVLLDTHRQNKRKRFIYFLSYFFNSFKCKSSHILKISVKLLMFNEWFPTNFNSSLKITGSC